MAILLHPVTHQVALANPTYARLRAARRAGESFSQAIERLLDGTKDPMSFVRDPPKSRIPAEERLRLIKEERDADRVDL